MTIWMEILCCNSENPSGQAASPYSPSSEQCFVNSGNMPAVGARANQKSIIEEFKFLETEANKLGWLKTKYGWICPYCAAQPNVMVELAADDKE